MEQESFLAGAAYLAGNSKPEDNLQRSREPDNSPRRSDNV